MGERRELLLSDYGLETVQSACARKKWSRKSVVNWIADGSLSAIGPLGSARGLYLLLISEVDAFVPRPRGRPRGKAEPEPAPKPRAKQNRGA